MRWGFWPSPWLPFTEVVELCAHAEATGWDGVWVADHFMSARRNSTMPFPEAWTTLSAIAARVPRVRVGTMVTGNTYRNPAVLAKMAATLDHISGGRVVLGLGAGWQENEHRQYGIEFSDVPGRLARLDEACQVIKSLYTQPVSNFEGRYYRLTDATLDPKPVQRPLPLLIGGGGEKVTLKITAKYADEWNHWGDAATMAEGRHPRRALRYRWSRPTRNPAIGGSPAILRANQGRGRRPLGRARRQQEATRRARPLPLVATHEKSSDRRQSCYSSGEPRPRPT